MVKLSPSQRLAAGLVPLLAIMIVAGVAGYRATTEFTAALETYKPSYITLDAIGRVRSLTGVIEIAGRNAAVSGDENTIKQFKAAAAKIDEELDGLKKLTADSPLQQERATTLADMIKEQIGVVNRVIKASRPRKQKTAPQPAPQKQEPAHPASQEAAITSQPAPQKQETAPQPQEQAAATQALSQKQEPQTQQAAAPPQLPQKQEATAPPQPRAADIPAYGGIKTILDRMEEDEKKVVDTQSAGLRTAARRPILAVAGAGAAAIAIAVLAYFYIIWEVDRRQRSELRLRESEERLRESEKRFGLLAQGAREYAFAVLDTTGRVIVWNAAAERMLGYSADEIRGKFFSRFYPEDDARRQPGRRIETAALQGRFEEEGMRLRRDGTLFPARETIHALRDDNGKLSNYVVVLQDQTEQRQSREMISKLELSVEHASDLVAITRPDGTIDYVNHAAEEVTGYAREELVGKTLDVLRSPEHVAAEKGGPQADGGEGPDRVVTVNKKKNGELFYLSETVSQLVDREGKATHVIVTARDITRQRSLEGRLSFLAHYDPLTGVSNRDDFEERLRGAVGGAKDKGKGIAVLVLAVDRFKYINDVFGSDAGNTVLKLVAERIREIVGARGVTARLGSDEFGVLLEDIAKPADVVSAVGSIIENVSRGVAVDGRNVFVTLSIGAALHPSDGEEAKTLMKNADIALAQAKAGGINTFRFYSAEVNARISDLVVMEQQLFGALRNNEYEVSYQPYCDMEEKKMRGAEALIRWINRDLGVVAPARFIRTLESTGMIIDVGAWVLKTVCSQMKKMGDGKHEFPVSVNLSAAQFRHDRLIDMIRETIKAVEIHPKRIVLEVTESVFMEDILFAQSVLKELKRIGVAISIDDFGTGYSSLSYLKKLPVDVIKIDQAFVRDVTSDPDTASIITSITSMARNLGIKTIAEGVETEDQWKVLRLLRCDMGQGYYFSRALNIADFERYYGLGSVKAGGKDLAAKK
jgi:diguanylate cyclase (GGDEF)-like protein/PAS domain S-box-containing protein